MEDRIADLSGRRYGMLFVLCSAGREGNRPRGPRAWSCLCDCGKVVNLRTSRIVDCNHNCGCLKGHKISEAKKIGRKMRFGDSPDGFKACSTCMLTKPYSEFSRYRRNPDGFHWTCKSCVSEYRKDHYDKDRKKNKEWLARNPGKVAEYYRRYKNRNLESKRRLGRAGGLRRRYGMTTDQYEVMLLLQDGSCVICQTPAIPNKPLHVDHDPDTNVVRGLLCGSCNRGIGMFKHKPDIIRKAADYLDENNGDGKRWFFGDGSGARTETQRPCGMGLRSISSA